MIRDYVSHKRRRSVSFSIVVGKIDRYFILTVGIEVRWTPCRGGMGLAMRSATCATVNFLWDRNSTGGI